MYFDWFEIENICLFSIDNVEDKILSKVEVTSLEQHVCLEDFISINFFCYTKDYQRQNKH